MTAKRIEKDALGEREVPQDVYYGIQTLRATENFPISGLRPFEEFILATVHIKKAAARVHRDLGILEEKKADAIIQASNEILQGKWLDQFVVDVFQAGAGTSHNMNTNEVIANRAIEILGGSKGDYSLIHPNDHVNKAQSTNDVFPTAMRLAALFLLRDFYPVLEGLSNAFREKATELKGIVKSGRTHLQDAVPIRLDQEFGAYARSVDKHLKRIRDSAVELMSLGIGGTAVGTGLNTHHEYAVRVTKELSVQTGFELSLTEDPFEAMQSMAPFSKVSSSLKDLALDLIRIANDLRLMSSGPRTGLSEISLPPVQPGSSIMPGKVNPVMAEVLNMVCYQVVGSDLTITMASQAGQLELNVMMPVISCNLLSSIKILRNGVKVFTERCVKGIEANVDRCKELAERSLGLATTLSPYIGYSKAAEVVREAMRENKTIREVLRIKGILQEEELKKVLDLEALTEPNIPNSRQFKSALKKN